jgi:type II secretory pathway pseudopilin PulG
MSANVGNDPEFNHTIAKPSAGRRFTLLKVLAVLGILALLIALLLPATRSARPAAYRAQCVNNLKQIAMALHSYEQAHKAFPPAHTVDANGRPLHSWRTLILPYLEQQPLYQSIDLSKPWNDPANAQAIETSVPVFHCPAAVEPQNLTTYLAITGPDACLLPRETRRLAEITDYHGSSEFSDKLLDRQGGWTLTTPATSRERDRTRPSSGARRRLG